MTSSAWQGSQFLSYWYDASGNRTPDLPLPRRTPLTTGPTRRSKTRQKQTIIMSQLTLTETSETKCRARNYVVSVSPYDSLSVTCKLQRKVTQRFAQGPLQGKGREARWAHSRLKCHPATCCLPRVQAENRIKATGTHHRDSAMQRIV